MNVLPPLHVVVGIATYNGVKFLSEQLDSIFTQTSGDIGVVAVDDCSSDGTWELLQDYAGRRPLRALRNDHNLGCVGNFERVLRECYATEAKFVALADQDDIWRPAKIETLLRHICDADLIYNPAQWTLGIDGSLVRPANYREYTAFCKRRGTGRRVSELLANNFVVGHQMLFRREVIPKAVPFPPGLRYHDHWIALTAARMGGIKFHQADLMIYRRHTMSVTFSGMAPQRTLRTRTVTWFARHSNFLAGVRTKDELLAGWEQLPGFTPADYAFMRRLRKLYAAMFRPGPHFAGAIIAASVGRFFFFASRAVPVRYHIAAFLGTLVPEPKTPGAIQRI